MYNIWLLEFFWTIFVQGQLHMIKGSSNVFINLNTPGLFSGKFEIITIFYITFFVLVLFVMGIAFLFKFIAISGSIDELSIKEKLIATGKNFGMTMIILIALPIIMYVVTIVLDLAISSLLTSANIINTDNEQFMNQLFSFGSFSGVVSTAPTNFGPPGGTHIENYNYFVQFVIINTIMFTYLYLMWTYFQKLLEVFILFITAPFSGIFKFSEDELRIKLWIREIKNKLVSMLMIVILFCFYNFIIMAIINGLSNGIGNNGLDVSAKQILGVIISLALLIVVVISVNIFNKKNDQYKGILKTVRSIQDSLKYNFIVIDNHLKKMSGNSQLLIEANKINHQLVEQYKNQPEIAKSQPVSNGLSKATVF